MATVSYRTKCINHGYLFVTRCSLGISLVSCIFSCMSCKMIVVCILFIVYEIVLLLIFDFFHELVKFRVSSVSIFRHYNILQN